MLAFADLIAKRAALRWLAQQHPQWTHQDLADVLSMSRSWVRKWLQRLHQADPDDIMALPSRTPARHTPPASIASQPAVVQRILEIRLAPPENLQRVPGPEAILYYLHRDPALQQVGVRLPRSQTTIWKVLRQAGCIVQDRRRKPKPLELRQPGEEVQFDWQPMPAVSPLIQRASVSMWWRLPTSSMQAPRSGYTARCAAISMRKLSSRW
jgi:hypothetical protein